MAISSELSRHQVTGLRVGRMGRWRNSTAVLYALGGAMIDCGPPNQLAIVRDFVKEQNCRQVLITHHHEDHSGNAAPLMADGLAVMAPQASLEPLAQGFPLRTYQKFLFGTPQRARPNPLPSCIELDGGLTLEPLAAPGHSSDMTCLLLRQRGWLFSGDALVALRPRYLRDDEDLSDHLRTLRMLIALDCETVFCAHLGVVKEPQKAFGKRLDYLLSLKQRARELDQAGLPLREITRRLLGREGLMWCFTTGQFSKRNLIAQCLQDST